MFPGAQSRQTSHSFFQLSSIVSTKGSSSEPGRRDPSALVMSPRAEVTRRARLPPPTRWGVALTPEDWGNEFQVQAGMRGGRGSRSKTLVCGAETLRGLPRTDCLPPNPLL